MTYTLADITVHQFMRCLFHGEREGIDNWEELFTLYVDISGMGETRQLGILTTLHKLKTRLSFIDGFIDYQKRFFEITKEPAQDKIPDLHKYGHRLVWKQDADNWEQQLNRVLTREKTNVVEMNILQKEFDELNTTGVVKEDDRARNDFIRLMNAVSKENGYRVDKMNTTMEEYGLMIKDYNDHIAAMQNNQNQ